MTIDWNKFNDAFLNRPISLCIGEIKTLTDAEIEQANRAINQALEAQKIVNALFLSAAKRFRDQYAQNK